MKLNLGCGFEKMEGFINIDKNDFDLNKIPYPYKDDSMSEIWAENIIEHLSGDLEQDIFPEWYRISKNHAIWTIIVPNGENILSTWSSFNHKRAIHKYTFYMYQKIIEYGFVKKPIKFEIISVKKIYGLHYIFKRKTIRKNIKIYSRTFRQLKFALSQLFWSFLIFKIKVVKGVAK